MKKKEQIIANLAAIGPLTGEVLYMHARAYIRALREGRVFCIIHSVSRSGMSREMTFYSCEKTPGEKMFWYRNYIGLFVSFGFSMGKHGIRVRGYGMNMVFATNYNIVQRLHRCGLLSKKQCRELAQVSITTF